MENKTKEQSETNEDSRPLNVCRNYIKLGDLEVGSDGYQISDLINALVWLLDNKSVKKYLDIVELKKKMNGSYIG